MPAVQIWVMDILLILEFDFVYQGSRGSTMVQTAWHFSARLQRLDLPG